MSAKTSLKDFDRKRISFRVCDETGVRGAFAEVREALGLNILETGTRFPDYILEQDGKRIRAEAEYKASDFQRHKHDPDGCDLIICWYDDLPSSFPVKRVALIDYVHERPLFDTLAAEDVAKISQMRSQLEGVFLVADAIDAIARDVHYMFQGDRRTGSWPSNFSLDGMRARLAQESKDAFSDVVLTVSRGWVSGNRVSLVVDLAGMALVVRGFLCNDVTKSLDGRKAESILKKLEELGGFVVQYGLEGSNNPNEPELGDLVALPKLVDEKRVSSMSMSKAYDLGEILSGDPYEVVRKLHDDLDGLLSLMEEEQLYVKEEKA